MATESPERPSPKPELLLANWNEELDSAELYDYLSSKENDEGRAGLLREMADQERRHARVMATSLEEVGVRMPAHRRSFKLRALKTIARVLGPRTVYPLIYGAEMTGVRRLRRPERNHGGPRPRRALARPSPGSDVRRAQCPVATPRALAPVGRRRHPACVGLRRQRRPRLQPEPRHGLRGRRGRLSVRAAGRALGPAGGRVVDGRRRVRLDESAA